MTPGTVAILEAPAGRVTFGVTRMAYRVQRVTVVGPVQWEPGMTRVRTADGAVIRTLTEYLRPE